MTLTLVGGGFALWWQHDTQQPHGPLMMCTLFLQMDTAGSIPVWVQNMVAPQQAQNVTRIRDSELLGGSARFAND